MSEMMAPDYLRVGDVFTPDGEEEYVVLSAPEYLRGYAAFCWAYGPKDGAWVDTYVVADEDEIEVVDRVAVNVLIRCVKGGDDE